MKKGDITCPACGAGFRRIELSFARGTNGEYRCPACDELLEIFDGSKLVAAGQKLSDLGPRATLPFTFSFKLSLAPPP